MRKAVIIGSGGHAKVVIDILRENDDICITGCLSRDGASPTPVNGVPIIGDDTELPHLRDSGITSVFVAIGDNGLRSRITKSVTAMGLSVINAVSRHAVVSPSIRLGSGVAIMPGAIINADTTVGDGVIVNTGATIDHDCVLASFCHIAPGSSIAGCVRVGIGAFLGIGTKVIPRVGVGEWSVTGAGTTIIADLPAEVLAVGVPARIIRSFSRT